MNKRVAAIAGMVVLVLLVLGWTLLPLQPVDSAVEHTNAATSGKKERGNHFPLRSATNAATPDDSERAQPDQEVIELVYPEGVLLTCPAPDLTDGPYRVYDAKLAHLRVDEGVFTGALMKPSEGSGLLVTMRGHHVAEIQWSEQGCALAPLTPLTLAGVVVDADGAPVADVEVVGCVGNVLQTGEDGTFRMTIVSGQGCYPFAFREDEDGFAKGDMVYVIGGETESLELELPGASTAAADQRKLLEQGAHQLMGMLERQYAAESPVNAALEKNPDHPMLQAWSDDEIKWMNLQYEDVEYLMSGDANEEDWRDLWLFGIGM